ncbi:MAG: aminoacyl-tRNA hydrolase, partial [Flavobacteriaceae bacterium]|nr:aminoacyl-tRNA hydrolase [Flavobacteriaceae bacterium]
MNFFSKFKSIFLSEKDKTDNMKKFLIIGLGNIGDKYKNTRHNIGFTILDKLAKNEKIIFETKKLGDIARFKYKGRTFILLKPNTYMNLSGKAVKYWQTIEKIPLENILVVTDDVNIPFGTIRLKNNGSAGGHNGMQNIQDTLLTNKFPRLRFGIGGDYKKGQQIDYVLGNWNEEEKEKLSERIEISTKAIKSFALAGIKNTMN